MTRKDKEREGKNVLTNGAHSCVNACFIPYVWNGESRIIQLITAWLRSAQLRWDRIGVLSSSKQQSTLFSLSSYRIPDFYRHLTSQLQPQSIYLLRPTNQRAILWRLCLCLYDMNPISYPHKVGYTVGNPPLSASHMPPLPQLLKTNNDMILQQLFINRFIHTNYS